MLRSSLELVKDDMLIHLDASGLKLLFNYGTRRWGKLRDTGGRSSAS